MPELFNKSLDFDLGQGRSLEDLRVYFVLAQLDPVSAGDGHAVKDSYGNELGSLELCQGTYYFKNAEGIYTYYYDVESGEWINLDFYREPQSDSPLYDSTSGTALANNAQRTGDAAPTRSTSGSGSSGSQHTTVSATDTEPIVSSQPVFETPPTVFVPRTPPPTPVQIPHITLSSDEHTLPVPTAHVSPNVFAAAPLADDRHVVQTAAEAEQIPPVRSGAVVCFAQPCVPANEPQVEPAVRPQANAGGVISEPPAASHNASEATSPAVAATQAEPSHNRDVLAERAVENRRSRDADSPVEVGVVRTPPAENAGIPVVALRDGVEGADVQHDTPALPLPYTTANSGSTSGAVAVASDRERYSVMGVDNHPSDSHGGEEGGNGRDDQSRGGDGEEENESDQA